MIKSHQYNVLISAVLLLLPFAVNSESWSCRQDNDVREIHVTQESSSPVPCSVVYKKLTEGVEDQVLWTAANDATYCLEKAQAFVDKQISWGWTCVETIADDGDDESAVTDEKAVDEPEKEVTAPVGAEDTVK